MTQESAVISVLDKISHCIGETRKRLSSTGEGFSPFAENLIYMGETGVSGILAMLLSPERSHCQGTYFLDAFLSMLPNSPIVTPVKSTGIKVSTERFTREDNSRRYIDIVVESPEFVLAVENKLWAADQCDQLGDYLRWLKKISSGRKFFLVYITPYGHAPSEYTLPESDKKEFKTHYLCLSWLDVAEMLKEAAKSSPPRISIFVNDFCEALKAKLGEPNTLGINMENQIVNTLAEKTTPEELIAAHAIYNTYAKTVENILNKWSTRLEEDLRKRGVKGQIIHSTLPNNEGGETYIIIVRYEEQKLDIGIYSGDAHGWVLCWGMWARTWEFDNDESVCMSYPPVKAAMLKFNATSLPNNNIVRRTCDGMYLDDPRLLDKLRQTDNIYLADEIYDLCQAVEHLDYELKK